MDNKRILIATIPEKGHINPMIGVAQHLQAAGFELCFFAAADITPQLHKAGLMQELFTDPAAVNIKDDFITKGKDFVDRLKDKAWLRHWIKTLLIDAVPHQLDLLTAAAEKCRPSLILTDPMIYAAPMLAARLGIPWAGLSSSLNPITPDDWDCELTATLRQYSPERDRLFLEQGFTPRFKVSDAISPWLNMVFSTEQYMPREVCGNDFSFYVGHSFPAHDRGDETAFPFDRLLPHSRKVYMSMGSQIYYHPQLFSAVAQALPDDDIQLIFSLNELYDTPFRQQLPANVIATRYTPQLQLLPQMDLFITHGGANSVMESMASGIPIAMLPICNDQFLQARFITRAGTGIVLDPDTPDPATYRNQLLPLLQTAAPEKQNARQIARSFQEHGGATEAAALIARLFETRQPLSPVQ